MKTTASIIFAADLYLSKIVENEYESGNGKKIFSGISQALESNDFRVVNLESPLTSSNSPIRKTGPNMKASPKMVGLIKDGGFDLATLANNHILDYGKEGVFDTIEICNSNGIKTVGAGKNLEDAMKPFRVTINDVSVSIINICEREYQIAKKESAGANPFDFYITAQQIKIEKEANDIVIVVYHGGNEYYNLPSPRLQKTFRFMIDMGADAVVGHHTHCNSGMEYYNGKPLFYSLGNFLFYRKESYQPWYYGFMVSLKINKTGVQDVTIYPYEQCREDVKIELLEGKQLEDFNNRFNELNKLISNDQTIEDSWNDYSERMKYRLLYNFFPPSKLTNYYLKGLKKIFGFKPLRKSTLSQFNYVRNEAHHELLLTILENYNRQT